MDRQVNTEPLTAPERATPPGKMTYEEFLAWADEDTWAEWVNGEVIILSPASKRHQDLVTFLAASAPFFCRCASARRCAYCAISNENRTRPARA